MSLAPVTKSRKLSLGPVGGPPGPRFEFSTGPAGPVCPEWLKYGPIERMTGVLSVSLRPFGRRMSAWSETPSVDGIVASVHVAFGGTSAAEAAAGNAATARRARQAERIFMRAQTQRPLEACAQPSAYRSVGPAVTRRLPSSSRHP